MKAQLLACIVFACLVCFSTAQYFVYKTHLRPTQAAMCNGKVQKYGISSSSSCTASGSCSIDLMYAATSTECATSLDVNYVPVVGDEYAATLSYGTVSNPASGCTDTSKLRSLSLVRIGECIQDSEDSFSLVLKNTTHISYFSGFTGYGSGICSGSYSNLYIVPIGCSEANTGYWNNAFISTGSQPPATGSGTTPAPNPGSQTGSASTLFFTLSVVVGIVLAL